MNLLKMPNPKNIPAYINLDAVPWFEVQERIRINKISNVRQVYYVIVATWAPRGIELPYEFKTEQEAEKAVLALQKGK